MAPLDSEAATLLARMKRLPSTSGQSRTPEQDRRQSAQVAAVMAEGYVPEQVASDEDVVVAGPGGPICCRLYRPHCNSVPPLLVYLHGGGWVGGGLDSHDSLARGLCNRGGLAVLSADYRLAPEKTYPAALEDALTVTRWASAHAVGLGLGAVAVGGDSAGGNLAAAVALACRNEGPELAAQLLLYPALDPSMSSSSYTENGTDLYPSADDMAWYWKQYMQDADANDPLLAPTAARDLTGLPPAIIVTAEYDVLRDEGDAYADRLRAAGVTVSSYRYPGLMHNFLRQWHVVRAADAAFDEIAHVCKLVLQGGGEGHAPAGN